MVIIVAEKDDARAPPPAYTATSDVVLGSDTQSSLTQARKLKLTTLPPNILLHIIYQILFQSDGRYFGDSKSERQRRALYWLSMNLRLVNRALYIACMHILRSTYLSAYASQIRAPYTSDPFPMAIPSADDGTMPSPINAIHRETQVLDYFLALKVREDVWVDDSELHLERDESFRDLFDLMQPRARLEDLIRIYGVEAGIVDAAPRRTREGPSVAFSDISISFSSRRVGLILTSNRTKRTIVEVSREKDESLEIAAQQIVSKLKGWLHSR